MSDHLAPVWTHLTELRPVRGSGVFLYDEAGERYLDFTSGIGVTNTGHCHPRVVAAIEAQAPRLLFGQMNVVVLPQALELAARLNELTPDKIDTFFFANSGAEAVEAGLKLAKHASGRSGSIVFQGSFHGRTHQAMAMTTAKTVYRHGYQPLPGGVVVAPFPASYAFGWDEETTTRFCLEQLELILAGQSAPDDTAAIVIEPILGEGGYIPAPDAFLRSLREICDRLDILLIFDEIQTGFGRTGEMFAFEHAGVVPDILLLAKGMGSGMPISAVGAPRALMERWRPGTHGGTYGGGNALVLAAASATAEVIVDEGLAANAAAMGARLRSGLEGLQSRFPLVGDVRGRGLMIGVEFSRDGRPDKASAKAVLRGCLERRLLLLGCGSYENTVRFIPPLVVTPEQIDDALERFSAALEAAHGVAA